MQKKPYLIILLVFVIVSPAVAQESENWVEQTVTNLKPGMTYTHPAFLKYFSQDVYDIFVGQDSGELVHQTNIGSSGLDFTFDDYEFGLFTTPLKRSAPFIIDLDKDGRKDLVVGLENGSVIALTQEPSGNFVINNTFVEGVKVDSYAKPVFSDIDKDGVKDMVVGEGSGSLVLFINDGTTENPSWVRTEGVFTIPLDRHPVPFPLDPDGDGLDDFIIGSERFGVVYLKNTGFENGKPTYVLIDSTNPGNPFSELSLNQVENVAPTLVDFDNDGNLDLAYGSKDGTLHVFKNEGIDFSEVDLQTVINLTDVIIIVAIVVVGIIVLYFLYLRRSERGDPQFILVGTDTGITPFNYSFNDFTISDVDLAGGAFAGINSIIGEITSSELNLLEAGDSKIIVIKEKLPNAGVTMMVLIWATANDKNIRTLGEKLGKYISKNFEEVFSTGRVTDEFRTKVETMVEFLFEKYV